MQDTWTVSTRNGALTNPRNWVVLLASPPPPARIASQPLEEDGAGCWHSPKSWQVSHGGGPSVKLGVAVVSKN